MTAKGIFGFVDVLLSLLWIFLHTLHLLWCLVVML